MELTDGDGKIKKVHSEWNSLNYAHAWNWGSGPDYLDLGRVELRLVEMTDS